MEALKAFLPLIFSGSLAALVLVVGLDATVDDLLFFLKHPRRLARAVVAICLVPPIVAGVMIGILPLHPISQAGIMLMAVAPVPPLVPGKGLKLGGRKAYVYGLYVTFAVLAVVLVPITVAILVHIYGKGVLIGPAPLARLVITTVLLPLAAGMAIHAIWPRLAAKAVPLLGKLSMALLVIACIPLFVGAWPAVQRVIGDGTVVAVLVIVAAALFAGHMLGGPNREDRAALAGAAATRHPGIALLIANGFQDKGVAAVVLLFMLVGVIAMLPYQLWVKRSAPQPMADAGSGLTL